jgi:hypothetical protein
MLPLAFRGFTWAFVTSRQFDSAVNGEQSKAVSGCPRLSRANGTAMIEPQTLCRRGCLRRAQHSHDHSAHLRCDRGTSMNADEAMHVCQVATAWPGSAMASREMDGDNAGQRRRPRTGHIDVCRSGLLRRG